MRSYKNSIPEGPPKTLSKVEIPINPRPVTSTLLSSDFVRLDYGVETEGTLVPLRPHPTLPFVSLRLSGGFFHTREDGSDGDRWFSLVCFPDPLPFLTHPHFHPQNHLRFENLYLHLKCKVDPKVTGRVSVSPWWLVPRAYSRVEPRSWKHLSTNDKTTSEWTKRSPFDWVPSSLLSGYSDTTFFSSSPVVRWKSVQDRSLPSLSKEFLSFDPSRDS